MVKISSTKILELRDLYTERRAYRSLNVLDKLSNIVSQNEDTSLPISFDIMISYCDYDTIKEVLKELGIPNICIRSLFRIKNGFHVQLS